MRSRATLTPLLLAALVTPAVPASYTGPLWSRVTSTPSAPPGDGAVVALIGGTPLRFGGSYYSGPSIFVHNLVHVFSPAGQGSSGALAGEWRQLSPPAGSPVPGPRARACGIALDDDTLLVTMGRHRVTDDRQLFDYADAWLFHVSNSSWTELSPAPDAVAGAPLARSGAACASRVPAGGLPGTPGLLLHAGVTVDGTLFQDTWLLAPGPWRWLRVDDGSPGAASGGSGGGAAAGRSVPGRLPAGATMSLLSKTPQGRYGPASWYVPEADALLVYGGRVAGTAAMTANAVVDTSSYLLGLWDTGNGGVAGQWAGLSLTAGDAPARAFGASLRLPPLPAGGATNASAPSNGAAAAGVRLCVHDGIDSVSFTYGERVTTQLICLDATRPVAEWAAAANVSLPAPLASAARSRGAAPVAWVALAGAAASAAGESIDSPYSSPAPRERHTLLLLPDAAWVANSTATLNASCVGCLPEGGYVALLTAGVTTSGAATDTWIFNASGHAELAGWGATLYPDDPSAVWTLAEPTPDLPAVFYVSYLIYVATLAGITLLCCFMVTRMGLVALLRRSTLARSPWLRRVLRLQPGPRTAPEDVTDEALRRRYLALFMAVEEAGARGGAGAPARPTGLDLAVIRALPTVRYSAADSGGGSKAGGGGGRRGSAAATSGYTYAGPPASASSSSASGGSAGGGSEIEMRPLGRTDGGRVEEASAGGGGGSVPGAVQPSSSGPSSSSAFDGDSVTTCAVCLASFEEGEELRVLPCLHRYHGECVDRWLTRDPRCPLCKTDVREFIV